ncbi:Rossmann-like domain-containing protein [Paenibacillus solani]|uniref:Rossmann-like domain-containing protein n=1 Tax=Paenibacillus solani TaxID=1705565 RepID=UPI003D2C3765
MKPNTTNYWNSVSSLLAAILDGKLGPKPEMLTVTGASNIYQTTQFASTTTKYHNYYLLFRVEASFGACSHLSEQLAMGTADQFSGLPLDVVLRDSRLPVQIAAMDAYLGALYPHKDNCNQKVTITSGTPIQKAKQRDQLIANVASIGAAEKVALIGVVNPLVEAIRLRGGTCLPCDLQLQKTQWGDIVEKDMDKVLDHADRVICTGMTLSNTSFDHILTRVRERGVPLTIYAQTGSAIIAQFINQGVTSLVAEPFPFTQFSASDSEIYCYTGNEE